ncbi:hypothetical protein B9Q13_01910 [Candidatus Marsarchaeota G2 archaeon ECH_B_SAG-G16]|uniref:Uncharacterized protein n=1 Tax=Candidatus Marsarchaeota G2 archaeon ECH_B_SAG-G16 TaxID=1978167 RepID=A0A2R6C3H0_9ARCH|nr:MAG: hypothetical protein B9Q13_01910 [Candidatus Marsarchaeota G2 archaeon ECH_B_SAG-G16]
MNKNFAEPVSGFIKNGIRWLYLRQTPKANSYGQNISQIQIISNMIATFLEICLNIVKVLLNTFTI